MSRRVDQVMRASSLISTSSLGTVDFRALEKNTLENQSYRRVVATVPRKFQLVLMCLQRNESIPQEIHSDTVQFFRVEKGKAAVTVGGNKLYLLESGDSIVIPPQTLHDVRNMTKTGNGQLHMYTIYTPPEHPARRHQRRQPFDS